MNRLLLPVILALIVCLFVHCARESAPSGGPKDSDPPTVLAAEPGQNALNFDTRTITMEFDEYVSLEDIENQLIISPRVDEKPKVFMRGKKLIVKLQGDLEPNTTYSLNFGEAVKDITEGNAAADLTYVLSTGDFIDTLSIRGTLIDAKTGLALKEKRVFLYKEADDSIVFNQKPDYVARTTEGGKFVFKNLPFDQYYMVSIDDKNGDWLYNKGKEGIAFSNQLIEPEDSTTIDHKIFLFQEDTEPQLVYSSNKEKSKSKLIFNTEETPEVREITGQATLVQMEPNITTDTVYLHYQAADSTDLIFVFEQNDEVIDTLELRNNQKLKNDSTFKFKIHKAAKAPNKGKIDLFETLIVSTKYPIDQLDNAGITLFEDSLALEDMTPIVEGTTLIFDHNWVPGTSYRLAFREAAVTDMLARTNKADTILLKSMNEEDYSSIYVELQNADEFGYYLALLLTGSDQLYSEQYLDGPATIFETVAPGSYKVVVIDDQNGNGKWDNGQYPNLQPEKVITTGEKPFNIKSGIEREVILMAN